LAKNPLFSSSRAERIANADSVVVIGLGRFGRALALELMATGTEVLGIDTDEDIVQSLNGLLTQVVRADSTKPEVLRQLAVPEFDRAVVAIGSDLQSSILTTSVLLGFDMEQIWAKAVSEAHGQILEQLGVQHVVYPESDMGRRVAHLVRGSALDFIEVDRGFAVLKMPANRPVVGRPLGETGLRQKHGVTIMAVRRSDGPWVAADAQTVVAEGDTLLVAGPTVKAETFGQLR
jgi:trk system potassium uptake protein